MDEESERRLLDIFRHLQGAKYTVIGLGAIADHWQGDSADFQRTLKSLLDKALIEIRGEGYSLTRAGRMAIS